MGSNVDRYLVLVFTGNIRNLKRHSSGSGSLRAIGRFRRFLLNLKINLVKLIVYRHRATKIMRDIAKADYRLLLSLHSLSLPIKTFFFIPEFSVLPRRTHVLQLLTQDGQTYLFQLPDILKGHRYIAHRDFASFPACRHFYRVLSVVRRYFPRHPNGAKLEFLATER